MAKKAVVLFDSIGYKPYPDEKDLTYARQTSFASKGETVELEDSEYDRLEKLGAIGESAEDAEAAMTATMPNDFGPPLPGQTAEQLQKMAESRMEPRPARTQEAYPTVASGENESDAQREAREASDKEGAEQTEAAANEADEAAAPLETAESPRQGGSGSRAKTSK